ncbi:type II secretion system protein GspD [Solimonas sp. K1W22B-7]|uniref:type II secretion system protein GspD n=1 Tax=Solimonas sp. K1W22B-7 TaxID=2303331 RepID=UPI0013C51DBA|nr:type II secretion system protein GspD [Solimonas sp. K1W22B-7]
MGTTLARRRQGLARMAAGLLVLGAMLPAAAQFTDSSPFGAATAPAASQAQAPAAGARTDVAVTAFTPSYVQTDRMLAALKALGYTVIEFGNQVDANARDRIFNPLSVVQAGTPLPAIIKLPDAEKTSLLDAPPSTGLFGGFGGSSGGSFGGSQYGSNLPQLSAVPDIGGSYLHGVTAGGEDQRVLIVYDPADRRSLDRLQTLLRDSIDVPARQVVIEALVIEVNRDKMRDLGITFSGADGKWSGSFLRSNADQQLPLLLGFNDALDAVGNFQASLRALVSRGDAEILSNPSVLVMDGRQARIQIGQQIPIVQSTTNFGSTQESVQYFPVGIVLNLRPRISENQKQVTMQVETIVSSVNSGGAGIRTESGALLAPAVDNRQVQTFVRVADNTPFIIGGLIATDKSKRNSGIPLLSDLPGIGGLFRRNTTEERRNEVIVVLTPHVVPQDSHNFSYTRPKDSSDFDSSDHALFRDGYRIRSREVFDLAHLQQSAQLLSLRQTAQRLAQRGPQLAQDPDVALVLAGGIPGEDILVRRMLWETVRNTDYGKHIDPDRIVLFTQPAGEGRPRLAFLRDLLAGLPEDQSLVLNFGRGTDSDVAQPAAAVERVPTPSDAAALMTAQNRDAGRREHALVLRAGKKDERITPLEWLRSALVLKRILDLNATLPLTISEFYGGRQIVYPTADDLAQSFQLIDPRAAQYWYEAQDYYPAFEREFNRAAAHIEALDKAP